MLLEFENLHALSVCLEVRPYMILISLKLPFVISIGRLVDSLERILAVFPARQSISQSLCHTQLRKLLTILLLELSAHNFS